MKRAIFILTLMFCFSALIYADYNKDIRSFVGKKVEITLANNPKSIVGVLATSEQMGVLIALVITNENGEKVLVKYDQVAVIREVNQGSSN